MPIAFCPCTTRLASFLSVPVITMALSAAIGAVDAQPSPRLPLGDAAYAELDQLVGSGLVRTVIYGQRPFTRREVARIIADASLAAERRTVSDGTRRVLDRLRRRFLVQEDPRGAPMMPRYADVEIIQLQSPALAIAPAPVGDVDANLNPLLNGRGGRRYAPGTTLSAEAGGAWSIGRRVTVQLAPRIAAGHGAGGGYRSRCSQCGSAPKTGRLRCQEIQLDSLISSGQAESTCRSGLDVRDTLEPTPDKARCAQTWD